MREARSAAGSRLLARALPLRPHVARLPPQSRHNLRLRGSVRPLGSARLRGASAPRALTLHSATAPPAGAAAPRWRACTLLRLLCFVASLFAASAAQCPSGTLAQVYSPPSWVINDLAGTFGADSQSQNTLVMSRAFRAASSACFSNACFLQSPGTGPKCSSQLYNTSSCISCINALAQPFVAAGVTDPLTIANCTLALFQGFIIPPLLSIHGSVSDALRACTDAQLAPYLVGTLSPTPTSPPPASPPIYTAPPPVFPAPTYGGSLPSLPSAWNGAYTQSFNQQTGAVTVTITRNLDLSGTNLAQAWTVPASSKYVLTSSCPGGCVVNLSYPIYVGDASSDGSTGAQLTITGLTLIGLNFYMRSVSSAGVFASGGVIQAYAGSTLAIVNSTVLGGSALQGGCIYTEGPLSLINSVVRQCTTTSGDGGCIYASATAGSVTAVNTFFYGCTAINGRGGAIFADAPAASPGQGAVALSTGKVVLVSSTITGCSATGGGSSGGGIYASSVYSSSSFLSGSTDGYGGAVYVLYTLSVDSSVAGGFSSTGDGGCLYVSSSGLQIGLPPVSISNSVFRGCGCGNGRNGGALYANLDVVISDTTFDTNGFYGTISNTATANVASAGGAVYVPPVLGAFFDGAMIRLPQVNITRSAFVNNVAQFNGAAIAAGMSTPTVLTITNCTFMANYLNNVIGRGGALAVATGNVSVSSTLFYKNSVPTIGGGGIFFGQGRFQITACNFTMNSGGELFGQGGAIHFQISNGLGSLGADLANSLTITDSLFEANSAHVTSECEPGRAPPALDNSSLTAHRFLCTRDPFRFPQSNSSKCPFCCRKYAVWL